MYAVAKCSLDTVPLVILRCVVLRDASLHGLTCPLNFAALDHSLLAKHGEEHDPLLAGEEERDSPCDPADVQTKLEESVA